MTGEVSFFFTGWEPLLRILVVGAAMYLSLLVLLQPPGSRALSRLNVFDFVVTIAIGATFGRALTAEGVTLAEAVLAFGLLVALQYLVGRARMRSSWLRKLASPPPALLYFDGEFREEEMRGRRITKAELREAARMENVASLSEADAIVLESNGDLSVLTSVDDVSAFEEQLQR